MGGLIHIRISYLCALCVLCGVRHLASKTAQCKQRNVNSELYTNSNELGLGVFFRQDNRIDRIIFFSIFSYFFFNHWVTISSFSSSSGSSSSPPSVSASRSRLL